MSKNKSNNKSQECKLDNMVTKCIIEEMGRNPISFVPIINEILSNDGPDKRKIVSLISSALKDSIITNEELKKQVTAEIKELTKAVVKDDVVAIIEENRISLNDDAKKWLDELGNQTMINLCEKYFQEKRAQIDSILDDYFTTIRKYIEHKLNQTSVELKKDVSILEDKNKINIEVPCQLKDKVAEYVSFLQSNQQI